MRKKLEELLGTVITKDETLREILMQQDERGQFDKKLMIEIIVLLVEEVERLEADSV